MDDLLRLLRTRYRTTGDTLARKAAERIEAAEERVAQLEHVLSEEYVNVCGHMSAEKRDPIAAAAVIERVLKCHTRNDDLGQIWCSTPGCEEHLNDAAVGVGDVYEQPGRRVRVLAVFDRDGEVRIEGMSGFGGQMTVPLVCLSALRRVSRGSR